VSSHQAIAVEPEVVEVLLKALDRAEEPVTAKSLRDCLTGPYKLPPDQLDQQLEELVARRRIYRFEPYKSRSPRYWGRDHDHYATWLIEKKLSETSATWSELKKALKNPLKGFREERLRHLQKEMLEYGKIQKLPPFIGARADRFSTYPSDPRDYVEDALKKIKAKLAKSGVTSDQVDKAALELLGAPEKAQDSSATSPPMEQPPDLDLERLILDRMVDIVPAAANGALVSLRELWRFLNFKVSDKSAFNHAVLRLADQGKVALHRHDYPAGLSPEEQAELVSDGTGTYYVGIAMRK
jgi:hypothetical protein